MIPLLRFFRILARGLPAARFRVAGDSMAPTLRDGQQVLVFTPGPETAALPRGAMVALRHPVLPGQVYIKRIVGLPGESIRIEGYGHRVYVEDVLLPEPYLPELDRRVTDAGPGRDQGETATAHRETARLWITDADEFFVMGDRREDSLDSRSFGPVHRDLILGRVRLRYWPPWAWAVLTNR